MREAPDNLIICVPRLLEWILRYRLGNAAGGIQCCFRAARCQWKTLENLVGDPTLAYSKTRGNGFGGPAAAPGISAKCPARFCPAQSKANCTYGNSAQIRMEEYPHEAGYPSNDSGQCGAVIGRLRDKEIRRQADRSDHRKGCRSGKAGAEHPETIGE